MPKTLTKKRGAPAKNVGTLAGIPPMTLHAATYDVGWEAFLIASQMAALKLFAPPPAKWRVDGWKSDKLFLLLSAEPREKYPGTLDAEFDLEIAGSTVTVSVFTRLPSEVRFFERMTEQLDLLLPRIK